jgi:O-methyltransferase
MRRFLTGRRRPPQTAPAVDPFAQVSEGDRTIIERCLPYTMTGVPRLQALVDAVRYLVAREVPGDFVECGVWRGGSVLAMMLTLLELDTTDRHVWLYDTFEGMTAPTEHDVSDLDPPALETWKAANSTGERPWNEMFSSQVFNEDDVRAAVLSSGYPEDRVHFVKGPVEETLPGTLPSSLALLRLDTDWYESTRHELEHLYPLLSAGGVLIVDDYGHWQGARRAVDEYFGDQPLLLSRIDYTARIAIKA